MSTENDEECERPDARSHKQRAATQGRDGQTDKQVKKRRGKDDREQCPPPPFFCSHFFGVLQWTLPHKLIKFTRRKDVVGSTTQNVSSCQRRQNALVILFFFSCHSASYFIPYPSNNIRWEENGEHGHGNKSAAGHCST